jgi:Phospholipid methyltransferase
VCFFFFAFSVFAHCSPFLSLSLSLWKQYLVLDFPGEFDLLVLSGYVLGVFLCGVTLWAKIDAYRVVKDFAWYWGDFFFLVEVSLTFDRVFALVPHPMYTIGYAFFYGCALLARSYTVLYVSLVAHLLQLIFLAAVENPHIEKTYPDMAREQDVKKQTILYDKEHGYFRRDMIAFKVGCVSVCEFRVCVCVCVCVCLSFVFFFFFVFCILLTNSRVRSLFFPRIS